VVERRIAVAYSGGRDSTALLHATAAQAAAHGVHVIALHVHHGLNPNADIWQEHCRAQCARWSRGGRQVAFAAHRVIGRPPRGESVEAWARQQRYHALRTMAQAHDVRVVLLAHHRRDQAETLLLQALRGGGVAGLAGMPRRAERDGIVWWRPWLDRPRAEIDAYIRRHRLCHIDDDSNADPRFARNRVRLQVWPALTGAFEHAEVGLADAATWAQEAHAALVELAELDLARLGRGSGIDVEGWLALSTARRSNVLRHWVRLRHGAGAPTSLVARLLDELPARTGASWPLGHDDVLREYRGVLDLAHLPPHSNEGPPRELGLEVRRSGSYDLPGWHGALRVQRVREGGVPLAWLARLELRPREGGEQFQAGIGRPPRSLKKQYQDAGVPSWQRDGPLVYSGGQLVFVPGLGLDARILGLPGQALATLTWVPLARAA
jgi:tRNA(Ile)-lysidine synthase